MIIKMKHNVIETAKEIIAVQTAAYLVEANIINYKDLPPLKENIYDIMNAEEVFLGLYQNERLGALLSYNETDSSIEICRLVVLPSLFGKGFASKLLVSLLNSSSKQFFVHTAAKNVPAIQLYKKFGFIIKKTFKVESELEIVKLEKEKSAHSS
ncbi:GNAT family N-acetyltransferase [Niallia nealsonii]|uniref:GNAT family N-acetyltransferase n=1 Tax=Niallia nealsonii TaxID=115979 RepID=A0A2N0Z1P7_9BACI|nr:GNAT family N-acetyltransferase [Niallia nealsonii]PKG23436.1 GNAT family N-acetyltransferase [Niallia nealsonii]